MKAEEVKSVFQKSIVQFISDYKSNNHLTTNWQTPLIGFADAKSDYFKDLKKIVSETHYEPQMFMTDCTIVISYFLPFSSDIGHSNKEGDEPSLLWVTAYNETNKLFLEINQHLIRLIERWGYQAVSPSPVGMIDDEHIYSNWSQRHVAFAAGLGTFGVNNMLITEAGTCGRLYSLITNLPVEPDQPLSEERCLYKRCETCGLCVKRCPIHALDLKESFDRAACAKRLDGFDKKFGADVCGKCVVNLPCTYQNPTKGL